MSDATLRLVHQIRQRIDATRRRMYRSQISRGIVLTLAVCLTLVLLAVLLEGYLWLPVGGRLGAVAVVTLATVGCLSVYVLRPLAGLLGIASYRSEESVAREIGDGFASVGDRLINLLHLADGRGSISDDTLREEAIGDLGRSVRDVPFEEIVSFDDTRRALRWAMLPAAGLLIAGLLAPSTVSNAGHRLLAPGTVFERPAPFAWAVSPGDSTLVKGHTLTITARPRGHELPDNAHLEVRRADEDRIESTALRADSAGDFRHQQPAVRRSLRYRVSSGRVSSEWHSITVVEQPLVRRLQVTLSPPGYTGLPDRTLSPNVGDFSALPGTDVGVTVTSDSGQLAMAAVAFADGDSMQLEVDGPEATGSFVVGRATNYHVALRNPRGISNGNPIRYQIQTLTDEAPSVEFQAPAAVSDIEQDGQKDLEMRMTDDYGFTRLRLYYRLSESRFGNTMSEFRHIDLPLDSPDQLDQALAYTWRIASATDLDPVRGDVIEYYVEVTDNNSVAGYQAGRTATQLLRYPSLAQQYSDLDREQSSVESSLESLREEADAMQKEFESLRENVHRQQEGSWNNRRSVEQLEQRQQSLREQTEKVSKQIESMTRQMENQNLVSDETLQMYEDLQRVVEEMDSPELQKALQKLQEAMQNMDMQSMQEALQNFQFNEQEYQKRLQRTRDLFKKLQTQQKLEEVARRTDELAEQQRRMAERTEQLSRSQEPSPRDERPAGADSTDAADQSRQGSEDEPSESPSESASENTRPPEDRSRRSEQSTDSTTQRSDSSPSNQNSETSSSTRDRRSSSPDRATDADNNLTPSDSSDASNEKLARQQERSREEMQAIEKETEQLREQMRESRSSPRQQLEKLQKQMQQQNLPRQMQENSRQLRRQQFDQARQGQRSMQQQLKKMSKQMSAMQRSMQSRQMNINIAGIRQALEDVLHLSREQENLRRRVSGVTEDSPVLRDVSQRQVSLSEGLATVNDSLQSLAGDIPRMSRRVQQRSGEALRAMSNSVDAIGQRQLGQTATHQKSAMEHLNNLAVDLSELLEQLQNMQQQGGMGNMSMQQMMQQMQQMAGQQQMLNEQIQQLLNDVQGNRLSQGQQERLQQMRRQQQRIRRQLENLRNNSGAQNDMLGDLEKIARQMEESIRELRERSVSREMVQRQQQILNRLLQAQQSLQTQGKEDRRRSQTGDQVARESPDPLTPTEQAEQLRRDLLRALESGYAPDYEELIKKYFNVLQERDRSEPRPE